MTQKDNIPIQQVNINYRATPVFSDRSITATQVASKPSKTPGKAERKEGTIRLIFVDSVTQTSVADIILTPIAAEQLLAGLRQSLDRLFVEIKDMKMPANQQILNEEKAATQTYIG